MRVKKLTNARTLSEEIADKIKEMIIGGQLEPGQQVPNEQELIKEFNVSRTTVREAIKILVSKNILEIQRGKGTFVCAIPGIDDDPFGLGFLNGEERYFHMWEARMILEPYCGKLAALRATDEEIRLLGEIAKEMEELYLNIESGEEPQASIDGYSDKEIEFHGLLYKMTKNPILERYVTFINRTLLINYTNATFRSGMKRARKVRTHLAIYEAIRDRDQERAFKLCEQHMKNGAKFYNGEEV